MTYRKRMKIAAVCSLVLHGLALAVVARLHEPQGLGLGGDAAEPVVIDLRPERPAPVRRLVDTTGPPDERPDETDLISDRNSQARDAQDQEGTREAPRFEEPDDFDRLAAARPRQPAPAPPAPPVPEADRPSDDEAREKPAPELPEAEAPVERLAMAGPAEDNPASDPARRPAAEDAAQGAPEPEDVPPGVSKGRVDGGVKGKGFLSFEAMQHEFAPYLKEVRKRVERNWNVILTTRYPGATPTEAVLDCVIRPDGTLESVDVVEKGDAVGYASLCREAIEKAAPFPGFPFDVPNVYRTRNLEIRWTFSFL